jgi:pyruvate kinase
MQINIPAGHEFLITTDPAYSESCDDQHLFVDYVRIHVTIYDATLIYIFL